MNAARQKQILEGLARLPENNKCVDCGYSPVTWCSINLSIFLCMNCAGAHRSLGTHISQVRSLTLDKMTKQQIDGMYKNTNVRFNLKYESKLNTSSSTPSDNDGSMNPQPVTKPTPTTTVGTKRTIGSSLNKTAQTSSTIGGSGGSNGSVNNINRRFMGGTNMRSIGGGGGRIGMIKPSPTASDEERFAFIKNKYELKLFYNEDADDSVEAVDRVIGRSSAAATQSTAPTVIATADGDQETQSLQPTVVDLFDINQPIPPTRPPQVGQVKPKPKPKFAFQVLKKTASNPSPSPFQQPIEQQQQQQQQQLQQQYSHPQTNTRIGTSNSSSGTTTKSSSQFAFAVKRASAPSQNLPPSNQSNPVSSTSSLFSGLSLSTAASNKNTAASQDDIFDRLNDINNNHDADNADDDDDTAFSFLNDDNDEQSYAEHPMDGSPDGFNLTNDDDYDINMFDDLVTDNQYDELTDDDGKALDDNTDGDQNTETNIMNPLQDSSSDHQQLFDSSTSINLDDGDGDNGNGDDDDGYTLLSPTPCEDQESTVNGEAEQGMDIDTSLSLFENDYLDPGHDDHDGALYAPLEDEHDNVTPPCDTEHEHIPAYNPLDTSETDEDGGYNGDGNDDDDENVFTFLDDGDIDNPIDETTPNDLFTQDDTLGQSESTAILPNDDAILLVDGVDDEDDSLWSGGLLA